MVVLGSTKGDKTKARDKRGELVTGHGVSLERNLKAKWSLQLKLISNLRSKHGTLRLPIYTSMGGARTGARAMFVLI